MLNIYLEIFVVFVNMSFHTHSQSAFVVHNVHNCVCLCYSLNTIVHNCAHAIISIIHAETRPHPFSELFYLGTLLGEKMKFFQEKLL